MVLDGANSAVEIPELLGPEISDNGNLEAHSIVSLQRVDEMFAQWVQQGR